MMGLNISFLRTCESWNTNSNCQEWHNTTSKNKVERTALWDARRILELLWKESRWTLREVIKSLINSHVEPPWRTPVIKEWSKEVKDEKNKIEALQWWNEALKWYNWKSLELWEWKNMKQLKSRIWWAFGIRN